MNNSLVHPCRLSFLHHHAFKRGKYQSKPKFNKLAFDTTMAMQNRINQRRVSFASSGRSNLEELNSISNRERRAGIWRTESFENDSNNTQSSLWKQFGGQRSRDYDSSDGEFSVSVAAAAFAIHSLEETDKLARNRGNDLQSPSFGVIPRRFSIKDAKYPGDEASMKNPSGQNLKPRQDSVLSMRKPSDVSSSSLRRPNPKNVGTKVDAWERTEIEKIQKRYTKMNSTILAWENEKKMRAKTKLEKRKIELERRKAKNLLHYQLKMEKIEGIAKGTRSQMEEKRRSEELKVKEKAKKMRSIGRFPVSAYCFCF